MKQYKSTDITRKSGEILEDAIRGPVSITKYNRSTYVLMSAKHYDKITESHDGREVFTLDTVTPDVKNEMLAGIYQELTND